MTEVKNESFGKLYGKARLKQKQDEAKYRQAQMDEITPAQRLAHMDNAFGKGIGAQRERKRLQALIDNAGKKVEAVKVAPTEAKAERKEKQKKKEKHDKNKAK